MDALPEQSAVLTYADRGLSPAKTGWVEIAGLILNFSAVLASFLGSAHLIRYSWDVLEITVWEWDETRKLIGSSVLILLAVCFVGGVMAATARWQITLCRIGMLVVLLVCLATFCYLQFGWYPEARRILDSAPPMG